MRNIKMTMSRMQLNSKFVNNMLPEWGRFVTAVKLNRVQEDRVMVQNVQGQHNRGQGNNARGAGVVGYGGAQNIVGNANPGQARQVKCYNCNGIGYIARDCTQPKRPQNSEYFKDKMLLMQAQENGVALDEEQILFLADGQDNTVDEDVDEQPVQDLALNMDNVFQADDYDAFDSNVDEAPTAQTMFMANLSSAYPVYDEAGPSYDSDVLSEVHDNDHYEDAVCEHHEIHEMHDDYVKDNAVPVIQSNVSFVLNDAYMMIFNDMHELHAQSVSDTTQNTVVDNSLTVELATYKEQVELYERRARFELTEREQKIDEQLRIVITDRNIKEENLKKELYSVKMQLASTINHNKSMVEEVTSLKKDFKQKENRFTKIHKASTPLFKQVVWNLKQSFLNYGIRTLDFQITQLTEKVSVLQEQNELFRAENEKEHYLKHLKESVETLHKIVEEAKVERPFDRSLASAYLYTKHSQELILICELALVRNDFNTTQFKKLATTTLIRKKARVNCCTNARGSQPRNNTKKNRISPAKRVNNKKVEEYPRTNRSKLRTTNHVDYSSSSKRTLSKFGNLCKLGKYGNPQAKCLPVLVINGDPQAEYSL
ncbi:integrase, catalytic region, zinc finger, CCHC-type containing protein [Tanacetum coccineum]